MPTIRRLVLLLPLGFILACSDGTTPSPTSLDPVDGPQFSASGGGGQVKVEVCHRREDGSFDLIVIGEPGFDAHVAHGDAVPGDPVPDMSGYVFDDACVPVAAVCPEGMAFVDDLFCIDRWEAHVVPHNTTFMAATAAGVLPQGDITQVEAEAMCQMAGKRLCTDAEWLRACRGPESFTYPYGNVYDPNACNEGNFPDGTLELTGANAACVSAENVFDLHGNLEEWTADPLGTFRGGYYFSTNLNGDGCLYRTTAHNVHHRDVQIGFRCCADSD
jgi:hypothetical protein